MSSLLISHIHTLQLLSTFTLLHFPSPSPFTLPQHYALHLFHYMLLCYCCCCCFEWTLHTVKTTFYFKTINFLLSHKTTKISHKLFNVLTKRVIFDKTNSFLLLLLLKFQNVVEWFSVKVWYHFSVFVLPQISQTTFTGKYQQRCQPIFTSELNVGA